MKNFIYKAIGLSIIVYLIIVIIQVILVASGQTDETWSSILGHILAVLAVIVIVLAGQFFIKSDTPSPKNETELPTKQDPYNVVEDKLQFGIYRQQFETWWYDNDGDKQHQSYVYASLRFYEDGQVIGNRSEVNPKRELPESYSMGGKWIALENTVKVNLVKTSQKDETVHVSITEKDQREMTYAGEIATDKSLIGTGEHTGRIKGNMIYIDEFIFVLIPTSTLIITMTEESCDRLEPCLKTYSMVIDTFQTTGNWYSNGETGPEWNALHIVADKRQKVEIDKIIQLEAERINIGVGNTYWS